MKKLLLLALILVTLTGTSACRSSARKAVLKRNDICGTDLRIPEVVRQAKPVTRHGKPTVSAGPFIALLYHASDLSACLQATQCILELRETEQRCAENYIEQLTDSYFPAPLTPRPKCKALPACIDRLLKEAPRQGGGIDA